MWYRHSGEEEIEELPFDPTCRQMTQEEIAKDIGVNHITHMCIQDVVPGPIEEIAPLVTHLQIEWLTDISQLDGCVYSCLLVIYCFIYRHIL